MVILKSRSEIEEMRKAGRIVAAFHQAIAGMIQSGVTTHDIESFAVRFLNEYGAKAYTIGYNGYPFATCASVNDVIAHGFPNRTPLKEGDIVKIDIVAEADGWIGDSAWCYAVGEVSEEARNLMRVTQECLYLGIEKAVVGNRIGDVMHAVQTHAERNGFSVVRDLLGHGVGREMHEEPSYSHIGNPGKGFRFLTIEPMLNAGKALMTIDADGWTARTADGSLSAQYEYTIAVTADGPVILTAQ